MRHVGKGQSINNSLRSETVKLKQLLALADEPVHVIEASSDRLVVAEKQGVEAGI